jgi:hypothetical protein
VKPYYFQQIFPQFCRFFPQISVRDPVSTRRSAQAAAIFYENGKLKSCKLTKVFSVQHKGERFVQAP